MLRTVERTLKAFADRSRSRILKLLQHEQELCVCQIASVLGLDQSTVSRHLAVLRNAGIVEDRKEGRLTYYRILPSVKKSKSLVGELVELLRGWLEEDEHVLGDQQRCELVKQIPVEKLCAQRNPRRRASGQGTGSGPETSRESW